MPIFDTTAAVQELKASDPSNEILQEWCVPKQIGGHVQVILGIRYKNIGPKPVHSLPSGLTIYSINLECSDPSFNAAIGGPHKSLSAMFSHYGGSQRISQILLVKLETYKHCGAPKIPHIPMTKEEMAIVCNSFCGELGIPDNPEVFLHYNYSSDDDYSSHSPENGVRDAEGRCKCSNILQIPKPPSTPVTYSKSLQCVSCKMMFQEIEKLRDMKSWYKQMEAGTNVEYRCPACRDCSKCKNSDFTDKISIREEVEQKQIEDSITFDRVNKKILVSLPKRGEEKFFLSSNRESALKIYHQMCRKASKDPSVKTEIVEAVEKLFKTGQALYLVDLEADILEKFV